MKNIDFLKKKNFKENTRKMAIQWCIDSSVVYSTIAELPIAQSRLRSYTKIYLNIYFSLPLHRRMRKKIQKKNAKTKIHNSKAIHTTYNLKLLFNQNTFDKFFFIKT